MLLCFQHHGLGDVMIIRKTEIHLSVVEKEKWKVKSAYEPREEFWYRAKPGTVTLATRRAWEWLGEDVLPMATASNTGLRST